MHDATPVFTLLVLSGCGLLWLGLHWLSLPSQRREQHLTTIARAEGARTLPPVRLADQGWWLVAHRLARLQGLTVLVGVAALVGGGEGLARRRRDHLAGMRLRTWTLGVVSVAVAPGLVAALVLCPVAWTLPVVASVGAVWSAVTVYCVLRGVPYVA